MSAVGWGGVGWGFVGLASANGVAGVQPISGCWRRGRQAPRLSRRRWRQPIAALGTPPRGEGRSRGRGEEHRRSWPPPPHAGPGGGAERRGGVGEWTETPADSLGPAGEGGGGRRPPAEGGGERAGACRRRPVGRRPLPGRSCGHTAVRPKAGPFLATYERRDRGRNWYSSG